MVKRQHGDDPGLVLLMLLNLDAYDQLHGETYIGHDDITDVPLKYQYFSMGGSIFMNDILFRYEVSIR